MQYPALGRDEVAALAAHVPSGMLRIVVTCDNPWQTDELETLAPALGACGWGSVELEVPNVEVDDHHDPEVVPDNYEPGA